MSSDLMASRAQAVVTALRPGALAVLLRRRRLRQTAGYVGSTLAVQALGAIVTTLLARSLTVQAFGGYSFARSSFVFLALFFEFGLFVPASRLAARGTAEQGRAIVGASLVTFVPVAALYALTLFVLSFHANGWFHVAVAHSVRAVALLTIAYPFELVAQQLAQGLDRLHIFSICTVMARVAFVCLATVFVLTDRLSITTAMLAEVSGMLVGWAVLVAWMRPVFSNAREGSRQLFGAARAYGFPLYVGRVLAIGTYNMDVLMVAAFTDSRSVSFYTLAAAIASPVGLPGSAAASALFPRMALQDRLPASWIGGAALIGLIGAVGAAVLTGPFVSIVLADRYAPVVPLVLPLALAAAVRGTTTVYNSFLTAHAEGRALRDASIVLTSSNILLNIGLIPRFGPAGAAWASLAALIANLLAHVVSYQRMSGTVGAEAQSLAVVDDGGKPPL